MKCLQVVGTSQYQILYTGPEEQPEESELKKLNLFISTEIAETTARFNVEKYTWLRSLIVCRLTLYNGRRGDEPSRLLKTQWQDAMDNVWLPSEMVEQVEDEGQRYLIGQFKLAYLLGKGKKFVPVLIPTDVIEAT